MELSSVSIANMALGLLGVRAITAFTESSNEARAVYLYYDPVRREILRDYSWRFASASKKLIKLNEEHYYWKYFYEVPNDCLFVREVLCKDGEVSYEVIGGKIGSNVADGLWCNYTRDVQTPNEMDALFIEAFTWKLSGALALYLSRDKEAYTMCVQMYSEAVRRAAETSGLERKREELPFTSYIRDGRGLDV